MIRKTYTILLFGFCFILSGILALLPIQAVSGNPEDPSPWGVDVGDEYLFDYYENTSTVTHEGIENATVKSITIDEYDKRVLTVEITRESKITFFHGVSVDRELQTETTTYNYQEEDDYWYHFISLEGLKQDWTRQVERIQRDWLIYLNPTDTFDSDYIQFIESQYTNESFTIVVEKYGYSLSFLTQDHNFTQILRFNENGVLLEYHYKNWESELRLSTHIPDNTTPNLKISGFNPIFMFVILGSTIGYIMRIIFLNIKSSNNVR